MLHSEVKDWLKMGIIQASSNQYNTPILMVPKNLVDYRALNAKSVDDNFAWRTMEDCTVDIRLMGITIFTSLDLKDWFYQIPLEKASRPMT
jgi:hypothetical protein